EGIERGEGTLALGGARRTLVRGLRGILELGGGDRTAPVTIGQHRNPRVPGELAQLVDPLRFAGAGAHRVRSRQGRIVRDAGAGVRIAVRGEEPAGAAVEARDEEPGAARAQVDLDLGVPVAAAED